MSRHSREKRQREKRAAGCTALPSILRVTATLAFMAASGAEDATAPALASADPPLRSHEPVPIGDTSVVDEHQWLAAIDGRLKATASAPQAVAVVTGSDLIDLPSISIPDRLRYIPGVDVYQERHGQFDVGIHGYNGINNNRVLAQYDGREFTIEEFGSVMWIGTLNLSDVSRIEILKGPSSVTYGANAFGGVIVIHDREVGHEHQVFAIAGVGSDAYREGDITVLGPLGDAFYYKLSAGGSHLGDLPGVTGFTTYTPSPRTANNGDTDLESVRFAALLGWRLPGENRAEIEYHDLDLREWDFVHDLDTGSNHATVYQDDGGVRLLGPWGEVRQLHAYAYKDYSNQKAVYDPTQDFRYSQAGFRDTTDISRAQFNQQFGSHFATIGGEFYQWRSRSNLWSTNGSYADQSSWATVTTRNRGGFVEDQWSANRNWTLTGGLRVDAHSQAGVNWSPRLALNYTPDKDEFWRLSLSRGYRLPTGIETYIQQYYFRSDPNLDAETIGEAELGWQRRIDESFSLGTNAFYSRSNRQIWTLPLPAAEMATNWNAWLATGPDPTKQPGPFFAFENLDNPVNVLGLELSGDWRMLDTPYSLFSNGTWQYYRHEHDIVYHSDGFVDPSSGNTIFKFDRNLGRQVDAPPEWKANLGVRYESGRCFASIAGRYVANRQVFSFANSYFDRGGPIEVEDLPPYIACDVSIGVNFSKANSYRRFLRLSVFDVFDSRHYESFAARQSTLLNTNNHQYTSEIGREITLQAGWEF